ncbi:MAG: SIR2 family protein [Bacteroidales bacterium]|nr:SIR2 family protein [Bacteroidales bacterium]
MNRNVLLFGAGAVQAWGGPKTCELTELIRTVGFKCTDNSTTITEYIYQTLLQSGYNEADINFETIINAIEELIVYHAYYDKEKKLPSIPKVLFDPNFYDFIMNYSLIGNEFIYGSRIQIPKGVDWHYQHGAYAGETQEQYFLQLLLGVILTEINARIADYSWHLEDNSKINSPENVETNALVKKWYDNLDFNNRINRIYTLNYDRIFKILALENGVNEVFEGFHTDKIKIAGNYLAPDVKRILSDFNCHVHYNLHGSSFWVVERSFGATSLAPKVNLGAGIHLEINYPFVQVEKGKSILISNIITGYQKTQKSLLTPFRQMQATFDRDCLTAENLYIIGYSFGDEHINFSIKTALEYNQNLIIHLIDPIYDETEGKDGYKRLCELFIYKFFFKIFQTKWNPNKITEKHWSYFNGKFNVYTMGFRDYLEYLIN